MDTSYRFSIKTLFGSAWQHFKTRPWFFVAITLFCLGLSVVFNDATDRLKEINPVLAVLFSVATFFVEAIVMMGYLLILLRSLGGVTPKFFDLLGGGERIWPFLGATILFGGMVFLGLVALVVPGLVALSTFYFTTLIVIDHREQPFQAFKESARITKGIRLQVFRFILFTFIINIIGAIAFGLGLLITYPVSMLAYVLLYRELSLRRSEEVLAKERPSEPHTV